jgi:DNA-binding NarL/FixJ family response regulator
MTARILIADDNTKVRTALRHLLELNGEWTVCAEAVDGGEAVERARESSPDVVILDFQMPVMNGLQAAQEIAKVAPDVPVLLCTAHLSSNLVDEAQRVGLNGAVSKSRPIDILSGISALLRHEPYFRPAF